MSWIYAILASIAIWIVSFLVTNGGDHGFIMIYALPLLFFVVLLFLASLLAVLTIALMLARAIGKTFKIQLALFYVLAALFSAAIAPLLLAATPISNLDFMVRTMLIPSLLTSLLYPGFILRDHRD